MMKDAYEKKAKAQLDGLQADIDKLKAKAEEAEADTQLTLYKDIEELLELQVSARTLLTEIEEAGEDAWNDLKIRAETAWPELEASVKTATSRFV